MRIVLVSLCLSLVALGLGVFATVYSLRGDDVRTLYVPVEKTVEPVWSIGECEEAAKTVRFCRSEGHSCGELGSLQIAIIEHCP